MEFDDANLTRARFRRAYTYGWLLNASANVTYADLLEFELEQRRRSVSLTSESSDHVQELKFGAVAGSTADLCKQSYQVGRYRFTFEDLDPREEALQRSQIYNRLKRLFRENQNGEAALHCLYKERYYRTRSHYRYSPLTGGLQGSHEFKTVGKTVAAYVVEFLTGYGVRPARILRNLLVLLLFYFALVNILVATSELPVLVRTGVLCEAPGNDRSIPTPTCRTTLTPVDSSWGELPERLEYSLISMVNPDPQRFLASGPLSTFGLLFFIGTAILLALLFSSVFVRLLSD